MNRKIWSWVVLCAVTAIVGVRLQAVPPTRVVLQLHEVKAVDECGDWIEKGADEMSLGILTVDAASNVESSSLYLGKFGHDGSKRTFGTPREIASFTMNPKVFPQLYQAILVLAETDPGGGFADFMRKLEADAKKKKPRAAVGGPRLVLAGFASQGAEVVGQVAGEIAKEAAKKYGKRLLADAQAEARQRWGDEIFKPVASQATIGQSLRLANGRTVGDRQTFRYKQFSCTYDVTVSWRLK